MRVGNRILVLGTALAIMGGVFVGVEAQTQADPVVAVEPSEPGVAGDAKALLASIPEPKIALPDLATSDADFAGMPQPASSTESLDGATRLPWRSGIIRPNGDPVRRDSTKGEKKGVDLGSVATLGDDDLAKYPVPVIDIPTEKKQSGGTQKPRNARPDKIRSGHCCWDQPNGANRLGRTRHSLHRLVGHRVTDHIRKRLAAILANPGKQPWLGKTYAHVQLFERWPIGINPVHPCCWNRKDTRDT
jgi:hypothetical protein